MSGDVRVAMEELSPLLLDCLQHGQEVVLTVTGNSMFPFLRHRRDQVVLVQTDGSALQPGDVPLYRRRSGQYVLHRVVARDDGHTRQVLGESEPLPTADAGGALQYTMLGDAQTELEHGIGPDQILAVARAFYRKGKTWACDSAAYQRYVRRWHRLLPWRRPLVFVSHLPYRVAGKFKKLFCKRAGETG